MDIYTNAENVRTQMRRGVLEYCILCILSKKDSYATSILSELKEARMIVVEGTYYQITEKGRQALAEMDSAWQELVESIETIKNIEPCNR